MSGENKWKNDVRLGDDVYFLDDYTGVKKGVVINILDKFKPSKFVITDGTKIYEVLPTRVYQREVSAKNYRTSLLKAGFYELCEKLSLKTEDALFLLKIFKIEQKYDKEYIDSMINKKVRIVVSGSALEGILKYQKNYADDSIWKNFYYLEEPIGKFYNSKVMTSFQIYNIEDIKLI